VLFVNVSAPFLPSSRRSWGRRLRPISVRACKLPLWTLLLVRTRQVRSMRKEMKSLAVNKARDLAKINLLSLRSVERG